MTEPKQPAMVVMAAEDVRRLMESIGEIRSSVISLVEDMKRIVALTTEHDRALRGHNGEIGLVARVNRIEESGSKQVQHVEEVLQGTDREPGVLMRLGRLEETLENQKSQRRMLMAALVTLFVSVAVDIITLLFKSGIVK